MRKLEIDEYEELEDIEIALNKEIKLAKNKYNDFYFQTPIGKIIVDKKEKSNKYIVDLCINGFICENPNIREFYEKKEFTKNELIDFINNLKTEINSLSKKKVSEEDFSQIAKNKMILKGVNIQGISSYNESNSNYDLEKDTTISLILYVEDNIGNLYRLEFYETFGMCGSGYCKASWGNLDISKINETPSKYLYEPKKELIIKVLKAEENDVDFELKIYEEKQIEIGKIYYDYNGGDAYYPSGYCGDSFHFTTSVETESKKYFKYDKTEVNKILKLEERIKLEEPEL